MTILIGHWVIITAAAALMFTLLFLFEKVRTRRVWFAAAGVSLLMGIVFGTVLYLAQVAWGTA